MEILLQNPQQYAVRLKSAREKAKTTNLRTSSAIELISLLVSPLTGSPFVVAENEFVDQEAVQVKVRRGIPDFTIYSTSAWDEKSKQASFHDDEVANETFDEIVLRPFNHNLLHAQIWRGHLMRLSDAIEGYLGSGLRGKLVLNCGCGGGFEAQYLAEQGAKVIGFDISQLRAEAAATRFALNDLEGFFYRGDAIHLPFRDNTFDVVLYHDSLHHVPMEEIPLAVREARRVSKNLIVLSEAHDSPLRMLLESVGHSISIEASGNYTFRFKKSLIQFWCGRFGMQLLTYRTAFRKHEHRPKVFRLPVVGHVAYYALKLVGFFLKPVGNEALIVMKKS